MKHFLTIITFAIIVCSQMVMSQIPRTISYQGVLVDSTGTPKPDDSYQITFRLYDAENGGSVLWTEVKTLQTKQGLFSTALGDEVPFPYSMKFDQPYWLSIQVGDDLELTPRMKLNAVGYSLNSCWADTARVGLINIEKMDTLILGSSTQDGRLIINKSGSFNPIVDAGDYDGYGGSIIIKDEIGKDVGRFRPSMVGTGGTIEVYRDTLGNRGFYAGGNMFGDEEGYVQVYGSQRSAILYMGASGNESVVLPDSSISSEEILDEPGVAATQFTSFNFANNTDVQNIAQLTINIPAPGKIILQATGYIYVNSTTGTDRTIMINISSTPTGLPSTYGGARYTVPSGLPTDIYRSPYTCSRIFNAPSAGPMTFYLNGQQSPVFTAAGVYYTVFTAIYYPTAYGNTPVTTSMTTQNSMLESEENIIHENVTYQTAEEFRAYKKQVLQSEIDKLKEQIEKLEQKLNDQNDN